MVLFFGLHWSLCFLRASFNFSENRKCLKCDHIVKTVNGGKSGMHNHIKKCLGRAGDRTLDIGQSQLNYNISPRNTSKRGLSKIARLVYSANIPITKLTRSEDFAEIFRDVEYARVNYDILNGELEWQYHILVSRIESDMAKRDPKELLVLSLDKWTSSDNKKLIGFYLYLNGLTYCLGLVHYVGFCGSEKIIVHIRRLSKNFDLNLQDVSVIVSDCGSDVQKVAKLLKIASFPCLAHVINLIAKRLLLSRAANIESEDDDLHEMPVDEVTNAAEILNDSLSNVVSRSRAIVSKIKRSSALQDNICRIQEVLNVFTRYISTRYIFIYAKF